MSVFPTILLENVSTAEPHTGGFQVWKWVWGFEISYIDCVQVIKERS